MLDQIDHLMTTVAVIGTIALSGLLSYYYNEPVLTFLQQ